MQQADASDAVVTDCPYQLMLDMTPEASITLPGTGPRVGNINEMTARDGIIVCLTKLYIVFRIIILHLHFVMNVPLLSISQLVALCRANGLFN